MKYFIAALLGLFFVLGPPATASERQTPPNPFGLAMHGTPKYTAESEFLDYVNPSAPKGGSIKIAGIGSFDSVNPFSIKGIPAEGLSLVYDRLMQRVWDEPFTLYPLIAQSVDIAPDRTAITFHINPKARFHDGTPITAEDVLFSFDLLKKKGRPNMRRVYTLVEKVEIISPLSIQMSLGKNHDRETIMILAMMPVLSKAWWSAQDFDSNFTQSPVLNGPYKISAIDAGRRIIYRRVDEYWAKDLLVNVGQYNLDQITYEYFRDDSIALEAFKKGDLDLRREWDIGKWESAYNIPVSGISPIKLEIPHQRPERAHAMIFNLRRAPFDDFRIRKALSLAFDEAWLGKNMFHGKLKRIESYFPNSPLDGSGPMSPKLLAFLETLRANVKGTVFEEQIKISDTRSERERFREANALLMAAGWPIKNGVRVHAPSNKPFHFEMIVSTPQEEKIALNFKNALGRLGITMTIRLLDSATFQNRKSDYSYDMMMFFWQNTLSPGTEQSLYWSCASVQQPSQFNFSGICNPALDTAITKLSNAQNYEELKTYAQAIDRILLSEVLSIPLFYKGSDYVAVQKNIKKPQQTPLYGFIMETLWAEPTPQKP